MNDDVGIHWSTDEARKRGTARFPQNDEEIQSNIFLPLMLYHHR